MGPFIRNGDVVEIKEVPVSTLRVGDIILFQAYNRIVAHRIINKRTKDGQLVLRTKGDALTQPDPIIEESNIIGKIMSVKKGNKVLNLEANKWKVINYLIVVSSFFISCSRPASCGTFFRTFFAPIKGAMLK